MTGMTMTGSSSLNPGVQVGLKFYLELVPLAYTREHGGGSRSCDGLHQQ